MLLVDHIQVVDEDDDELLASFWAVMSFSSSYIDLGLDGSLDLVGCGLS